MPGTKIIKYGDKSITIPGDATDEDIDTILEDYEKNSFNPSMVRAGVADAPSISDRVRHYAGKYVPDALAATGATLGASAGTGLASIPGAATGAYLGKEAGSVLQQVAPSLFGNPPENPISDALESAAFMGAGPEAAAMGGKALIKGIAGKILKSRTARQALAKEGVEQVTKKLEKLPFSSTDTLDVAAQNAGQYQSKLLQKVENASQGEFGESSEVAQQALDKYNRLLGNNKIGQKLVKLNTELGPKMAKEQYYSDIGNQVFKDVTEVRNFKLATGETGSLNQLGINRILRKASGKEGIINAETILGELNGPQKEIYDEAILPDARKNLIDLATTLKNHKTTLAEGSNNIISYTGKGLRFSLGYLLGGPAGAGTMIIGEAGLKKLAQNPENVRLLESALRTPKNANEASLTSKIFLNALRGSEVLISAPDDKLQKGYVDETGKLVYSPPGK